MSRRRGIEFAPYLAATPLRNYPSLDRLTGAEVWVKHDNLLPTGAFKVRGGVNLISQIDAATRARGVIAASTGNHGQSVAFASRLFGVRATVVAPEGANPVKVEAMRDFGAEVLLQGRDYDEAREHCERLAAEHGYRYIHSGDEPHLIAGVGTHTLEILEERPDIDAVIVPIGGGSGAAGACHRRQGDCGRASRSSGRSRPRRRPLTTHGASESSSSGRTRPSPRAFRREPRSSCRSASCASCSTTSC